MRIPPNNVEAEKSVLGCCMSDQETLNMILGTLKAEEFYQPSHRIIYEAIRDLSANGQAADVLTVSEELARTGLLEKAGGNVYINSLPDAVPFLSHAMAYVQVVHEKYLLRQLILATDKITNLCYTDAENADELLDYASRAIYSIREQESISGMVPLSAVLSSTINEIAELMKGVKKPRGVPTGYPSLDKALSGGLGLGTLNILAARPAVGKSAFALNIALKAATLYEIPVVIFSLEMSKEEIATRFLAAQAHVDSRKLKTGEIREDDWTKISEVVPILYGSKIYIDDRTNNTPIEMLSRCRQLKMEGKCSLVVIDYLQLMTSSRRSDSRQQEISEISRSLKIMAKELEVPVIALSQLSRDVERRKDSRPMLSDLRESGAIEQDADVVMFLSRDKKDEDDQVQRDIEEAELILAKNRAGAVGTISLSWMPKYTLFIEQSYLMEPAQYSSPPPAPPPKDHDVPPPVEEAFEL